MSGRCTFLHKNDQDEFSSNDEEAVILELQSSDVESSTDDDVETYNVPLNHKLNRMPTWKATLNLANYTLGVGVLALPYAVMQGGITAILFFVITPFIYWYANKIIVECLNDQDQKHQRRRVRSSWKDIGAVLFPKYGGCVVVFLQNFILFLVSTSYLILCGSLMFHILPFLSISEALWTCIAALFILPTTFLKSYSQIAWLSAIGIITLFGTVGVIVWQSVAHIDQWDITKILFWDTEGVIISLGIILYGYAFFELIPSVEDNMKNRPQLGQAMAWTFLIVAMINAPFSILAFQWFGFDVEEIVVNNLPPGPLHTSIAIGFVISYFFSYSLPLQPAFCLLEESETFKSLSSKFPHLLCFVVLRISIVALTLILALLIPHFALLSAFDGSVITPILAFIIPCLVYFKLRRHQLGAFEITALSLLFGFGIVMFSLSTVVFLLKALSSILQL